MLIGIISDIHDRTANLRRALELLAETHCTHLLCLGDIASTGTLQLLGSLWQGELDIVAGNNDYPRSDFRACAGQMPRTRYHGDTAELELDGRRVFLAHEPERALHAAKFGRFDAIFFGHTHRAGQMMDASILIANPGDIQGRYGCPSFALYDTATHTLRHVNL